jgi:short-subunit dehydrogenase
MGRHSTPVPTFTITGASRGIGRAVALAAASRGAAVGLLARTADDLDRVAGEARAGGAADVAVAAADVADGAALRSARAAIEAALGPPDVVVVNAGIGAYGPFVDVEPSEIDRLVGTNVLGALHTVRAVVPGMVARRRGHVVVVASIAGRIGAPFEALYSATKFAQVGLAEALAVELSPDGVGVSLIDPGPVDTDFFEARGHPYDRRSPKPVPASAVVDAVLAAADGRGSERYVPRWLGGAVVVRHLVPPLQRWGTRRAFRAELARESTRRRP